MPRENRFKRETIYRGLLKEDANSQEILPSACLDRYGAKMFRREHARRATSVIDTDRG